MTYIRENRPEAVSYFEAEGLALSGRGKWGSTGCYFHGGRETMRVNRATGGWVCMSCGAKGGDVLSYQMQRYGVEFIDAAKALGCWVDDGQPHRQQRPRPLPAGQAIQVLAFESMLTAIAACNIAHGVQLTDTDRARQLVAAQRINTISRAFA